MDKTKNNYKIPWRGAHMVIARKVGCTSQYVSKVLYGKLGKYNERDTKLVKEIYAAATEIEEMLKPNQEPQK